MCIFLRFSRYMCAVNIRIFMRNITLNRGSSFIVFCIHYYVCARPRMRIWRFVDTWHAILPSICILYINTHAYLYISSWNRGNAMAGVLSLLSASISMYIHISRNRFHFFLRFSVYLCAVTSESSWENYNGILGVVSFCPASIIMCINVSRMRIWRFLEYAIVSRICILYIHMIYIYIYISIYINIYMWYVYTYMHV